MPEKERCGGSGQITREDPEGDTMQPCPGCEDCRPTDTSSPPDAPSAPERSEQRHPGHRVVLAFDSGGMFARLVCPDSDRCEHCEEVSPGECWLQSWFDALDGEELLQGEIEFPVSVEWDGDAPQVQIEAGGDASCR